MKLEEARRIIGELKSNQIAITIKHLGLKFVTDAAIVLDDRITELEAQRDELVEVVIKSIQIDMDERGCAPAPHCNLGEGDSCIIPCYTLDRIRVIEKVTSKTWEAIDASDKEDKG